MSIEHNTDHFQKNELLPRSYQEDLVEDIYKIHVDRSVNELSNQFCRYYFATNLKTEKECFALVFERSFNPAISHIDIIKKHPISSINKLLAYSLVKLSISKKYQFVMIVESYDPANTLQEYVDANGPMSIDLILNKLIPFFIKCFEFAKNHDLNYGNINPQNIIVTKNQDFILREFVISPPSFYQPISYLAPEIGDTLTSGRFTSDISIDIYALGMTVYYCLTGATLMFNNHDVRIFNPERIEEGTYNTLSTTTRIPGSLRAFLMYTLNDSPKHRWNTTHLTEWLNSPSNTHQYKAQPNKSLGHNILFESHNYSRPEALASAMYLFYESGIKLCKDENFIRWIQKAKGKGDNLEEVILFNNTGVSSRTFSDVIDTEKEEMMLKVFGMLDAYSPIRTKDFCLTIESIPHILFNAISSENRSLLDHISKILRRNYWKLVLTQEYKSHVPFEFLDKIINISNAFTKNASDYIGKQQLYLYDRYIPCLSPSIAADYVLSIDDLLVSLDKVATHTPSKLIIDEHITAFVASRLPNDVDLESKLLEESEHLTKSIMLKGISLLAVAQEHSHDIKIPHLCSILAQKLIEWINDNLHSNKLKKVVTSEIAELSSTGSLSQMLYVISNPQLFQNDYRGYKVALQQVLNLSDKIKFLSNEKHVHEAGLAMAQRVTVLFSYFLCMLVSLILVI